MAVTTKLTLDEFLKLPETEPASEFVCGEVIQKPMPTGYHGLVQAALSASLLTYLRSASVRAHVITELRHVNAQEKRVFVPDLAVFLRDRADPLTREQAERGPVERTPDIAIEILSPDDQPGRVADKLAFYLRAGVPLVWIVDPEARRIDAHRPAVPSTSHLEPESIDASPVLPNLSLDLTELFSVLDEFDD